MMHNMPSPDNPNKWLQEMPRAYVHFAYNELAAMGLVGKSEDVPRCLMDPSKYGYVTDRLTEDGKAFVEKLLL